MPEHIDRHTGSEVEVALTLRRIQPCAFAPLESEVDPCIGWQQMRAHGQLLPSTIFVFARPFLAVDHGFSGSCAPKRNVPPRRAALFSFYCRAQRCQSTRLNRAVSTDSKGKPVGS